MLRAIRRFFEDQLSDTPGDEATGHSEHALHLATAALAIETIRADFEVTAAERNAMFQALSDFLGLTDDETHELIQLAEAEADEGVSLYQFTSLIDGHYPLEEKIQIIDLLWRLSYADGEKDDHEEHLVRKVAHLLHVPHREFVRSRLRVEATLTDR